MSKTIAIMNRKGGIGKTTTAQALGQGLEIKGYKVLYVDLDAQMNLSEALGATKTSEKNIYNALIKGEDVQDQLCGNVLSGSPLLSGADIEITGTKKEYRLKNILEPFRSSYDYIVIDTPPALNILTVNALTASNKVIMVTTADAWAIQGLLQLWDTVQLVKKHCNNSLEIAGILLTKFNLRTILNRELLENIKNVAKQFNTTVYKTHIRDSVAIREAQTMVANLYEYAPRNKAVNDYKTFVDEFLEREAK